MLTRAHRSCRGGQRSKVNSARKLTLRHVFPALAHAATLHRNATNRLLQPPIRALHRAKPQAPRAAAARLPRRFPAFCRRVYNAGCSRQANHARLARQAIRQERPTKAIREPEIGKGTLARCGAVRPREGTATVPARRARTQRLPKNREEDWQSHGLSMEGEARCPSCLCPPLTRLIAAVRPAPHDSERARLDLWPARDSSLFLRSCRSVLSSYRSPRSSPGVPLAHPPGHPQSVPPFARTLSRPTCLVTASSPQPCTSADSAENGCPPHLVGRAKPLRSSRLPLPSNRTGARKTGRGRTRSSSC